MNRLSIFLLGQPLVYIDAQPFKVQGRLQRTLLFYLATHAKVVGRDELSLLLWPEERDARKRLRETLSKLRSQFPDPSLLITTGEHVSLDHTRVTCDVLEFLALHHQTQRIAQRLPPGEALPETVFKQMNKAVDLWRGQTFLYSAAMAESDEVENWRRDSGSFLDMATMSMLVRLSDHYIARGDLQGAISRLDLAKGRDGIDPEVQYRYLFCLDKLGRTVEALSHAAQVQRLFNEEGLEIPAKLEELCQTIREREVFAEEVRQSGWPGTLLAHAPYVGRSTELKQLLHLYQHGGAVVVLGEAGAGKTRLVYEFYQSLEPTPRLLLAPTRAMEKNLPFQPLIDLLRHSIMQDELRRLDIIWANQLVKLLPELSVIRAGIQLEPARGSEEARSLIFEALHQLFLIVARNRRILFFLDDAQWSDEVTLSAINYLLERKFFNTHGLLVVAARIEETDPNLEIFLHRPRQVTVISHLPLPQLTPAEVTDLTWRVLGHEPTNEAVQQLTQYTGGNPLFLLESLRVILEISPTGELFDKIEHFPMAGSIHALVRERLRHLRPQARQVLTTAAVIGKEFTPELLETATFLTAEEVVQSLDELEHVHLIQPETQLAIPSGYSFVHDTIRESLLLELGIARRRLLHMRVAHALEAKAGQQVERQAAVLANHFEQGGELLAAYLYWIQAGENAHRLRRASRSEAKMAFQRAERLLTKIKDQLSDRQIYQLYAGWSDFAADGDDLPLLQKVYTTLLQIGEQRRSSFLAGSGLVGLGWVYSLSGKLDLAGENLDKALVYLAQSDDLYERIEQCLPLLNAYTNDPHLAEVAQVGLLYRLARLELARRLQNTEEIEILAHALITWTESLGSPSNISTTWRSMLDLYDRDDPRFLEASLKVKAIIEEMRQHAQSTEVRPLFERFFREALKWYATN